MNRGPLHRLGENASSLWLQLLLTILGTLAIGVLGNAIWAGLSACGQNAGWAGLMDEAAFAGFWSVVGGITTFLMLRWLWWQGHKAQAVMETERREALYRKWPPEGSFQFIAEKCTLHADGRFVVAFICINKSELVWNIRRSVLTDLRSGKGAVLRRDIEDHSIHQHQATHLPPGGLIRTVFKGRLENLDSQEWVVGNVVDLYMGNSGMPGPHQPNAGHLVVYGSSVSEDAAVPFTALDEFQMFTLFGKVQA